MDNSIRQISDDVKSVNDKMNTLDFSKTEVMDRELEKELDNGALLKLRQKEFCLRFRAIPDSSDENITERVIPTLSTFLGWEANDIETEMDKSIG